MTDSGLCCSLFHMQRTSGTSFSLKSQRIAIASINCCLFRQNPCPLRGIVVSHMDTPFSEDSSSNLFCLSDKVCFKANCICSCLSAFHFDTSFITASSNVALIDRVACCSVIASVSCFVAIWEFSFSNWASSAGI